VLGGDTAGWVDRAPPEIEGETNPTLSLAAGAEYEVVWENGGGVTFGPDSFLYTSLGDGRDANDTGPGHLEDWYDANDGGNARNVEANLLGKILRIDVDSETAEPSQDGGGEAADQ